MVSVSLSLTREIGGLHSGPHSHRRGPRRLLEGAQSKLGELQMELGARRASVPVRWVLMACQRDLRAGHFGESFP